MYKAGDVFDGVRALLNDQDNAVFTNTVQLPYFKIAYEEIRQECQEANIAITNATSPAYTITTAMFDIGGPTGPALPNDFIELLECWENPAGSTNDYMRMKRVQFLPKTNVLTAYLEVYEYSNQYIKFLGATGTIDVKLDYISLGMPDANDENTQLKLSNAINYLKFRTAAYCAEFIDENDTRAQVLNDKSIEAKEILLNIKIKSSQNITTRRRPFMASYKRRGGIYGR